MEPKSRKKVRIEHRIECDEDRSKDGAFETGDHLKNDRVDDTEHATNEEHEQEVALFLKLLLISNRQQRW